MYRTIAVMILACVGISYAQEPHKTTAPETQEKKRLASVTWDLSNHKLVWVVEKGVPDGDNFKVSSSDKYEITPEDAVMQYAKEKRGFSEQEATSLQHLLDTLSLYCVESVVWWDQGEGEKLDENGDKPKREKVDHDRKPQRSAPAPDLTVASLRQAIAASLR